MQKIPKAKQKPNGKWFIQLRLKDGDGIQRSEYILRDTKAACEAAAAEIKYGLKKAPKSFGTLREAVDEYIDSRRGVLSPSTIRGYSQLAGRYFQELMDRDMTSVNWQRAVNSLDVSAKTKRNAWGLFSAAMAARGFKPDVLIARSPRRDMPFLTADQIQTFLTVVRDSDVEIAALLALHSLRRSELMALSADDIDLRRRIIRIRGAVVQQEDGTWVRTELNKTDGSSRDVPIMIPRLEELITALEAGTPVIRCASHLTERINQRCQAAELPAVGLHGLRRSFASLAYSLGLNERETMAIGGWANLQTVHKHYVYLSDQQVSDAAKKMAAFYAAPSQSSPDDPATWLISRGVDPEIVSAFKRAFPDLKKIMLPKMLPTSKEIQ